MDSQAHTHLGGENPPKRENLLD